MSDARGRKLSTNGGLEMRPDMPDGLIYRTARKRHECNGDGSASHRHADDCPLVIEPGMGYVENYNETPAYQSGHRVTVQCYRKWWPDARVKPDVTETRMTTHAFELQGGDVILHNGRSATVVSVSAPRPHGLGKMHFVDVLLDVDGSETWYSPEANEQIGCTRDKS